MIKRHRHQYYVVYKFTVNGIEAGTRSCILCRKRKLNTPEDIELVEEFLKSTDKLENVLIIWWKRLKREGSIFEEFSC